MNTSNATPIASGRKTRTRGAFGVQHQVEPAVVIGAAAPHLTDSALESAARPGDVTGAQSVRAMFLTPAIEVSEEFAELIARESALAQEFADGSLAENTKRGYECGWKQFQDWVAAHGSDIPVLPADPGLVAAYLAYLAVALDENGEVLRSKDGTPVGDLVPGTVALRLQAINRYHKTAGLPVPGDDPKVAAVLAGIRRTYGVAPRHQRKAIDMPRLKKLLTVIDESDRLRKNRIFIRLLGAAHGLTSGQIARITWDDIEMQEKKVTIRITATTARGAKTPSKFASHRDPRLCLVRLLHAMAVYADAGSRNRAVLSSASGRAYSSQAVYKALSKLAKESEGAFGTCTPTPSQLAKLIEPITERTLKQVRDRALLLTGWTCALRRSNIVDLRWKDLAREEGQWSVTLRWTKTDQFGADPKTLWLPLASDGYPCPASAMTDWHAAVTRLLGQDPCIARPDEPVFFWISRHGRAALDTDGTLPRLSGEAINELVQQLAYAAYPEERPVPVPNKKTYHKWGAHGLRAGFVTEAVREGKLGYGEIQHVTGHKSLEMVARYDRQVNSRANNPSRLLFKNEEL